MPGLLFFKHGGLISVCVLLTKLYMFLISIRNVGSRGLYKIMCSLIRSFAHSCYIFFRAVFFFCLFVFLFFF